MICTSLFDLVLCPVPDTAEVSSAACDLRDISDIRDLGFFV